jgi:hypothetical protein
MCINFVLENLKGRDHPVDLGVDGRIILKWILEEEGGVLWRTLIWLRIGNSGGIL